MTTQPIHPPPLVLTPPRAPGRTSPKADEDYVRVLTEREIKEQLAARGQL